MLAVAVAVGHGGRSRGRRPGIRAGATSRRIGGSAAAAGPCGARRCNPVTGSERVENDVEAELAAEDPDNIREGAVGRMLGDTELGKDGEGEAELRKGGDSKPRVGALWGQARRGQPERGQDVPRAARLVRLLEVRLESVERKEDGADGGPPQELPHDTEGPPPSSDTMLLGVALGEEREEDVADVVFARLEPGGAHLLATEAEDESDDAEAHIDEGGGGDALRTAPAAGVRELLLPGDEPERQAPRSLRLGDGLARRVVHGELSGGEDEIAGEVRCIETEVVPSEPEVGEGLGSEP